MPFCKYIRAGGKSQTFAFKAFFSEEPVLRTMSKYKAMQSFDNLSQK
jgi:hypothetical protein